MKFFIVTALLSVTSAANAATHTVKPGESVQAAIEKAMPGDTVRISDGEYSEDLETVRDGEIDKRIVITGTHKAVVRGTGKENRLFKVAHDYITVNGFELNGMLNDGKKESDYIDKGLYAHGNRKTRVIKQWGDEFRSALDGLIVSNMRIIAFGGECSRMRYFVTNAEYFGNHVENCGVYDFEFGQMKAVNGESLYIGTSSNQIEDGKNPTDEIDRSKFIHVHHNVLLSHGNELDCKEGTEYVVIDYNSCSTQKDVNSACLDSRTDNIFFRYNDVYGNDGAAVRIGGHTVDGKTWGQHNEVYGNNFHDNKKGALRVQTGPHENLCENKCSGACEVGGSASEENMDIEGKCPGVSNIFWVDQNKAADEAVSTHTGKNGEEDTVTEPQDEPKDESQEPDFQTAAKTDSENVESECYPVQIKGVDASSEEGKNTVNRAIDGKALTRWSAKGKEEWLQLDFGSPQKIDAIQISFFHGDERTQAFDVYVEGQEVLKKQTSSGKTLDLQRFPFEKEQEGSSLTLEAGGNSDNDWNSFTEIVVCGTSDSTPESESDNPKLCQKVQKLKITKASASAHDGKNGPENVIDGDLETSWAADGPGEQDIVLALDRPSTVAEIGLAVHDGDANKAFFDVLVETERGWEEVITDGESVRGNGIESYDLGMKNVNSVKIVGYGAEGRESGEIIQRNSFTEIELYGCDPI